MTCSKDMDGLAVPKLDDVSLQLSGTAKICDGVLYQGLICPVVVWALLLEGADWDGLVGIGWVYGETQLGKVIGGQLGWHDWFSSKMEETPFRCSAHLSCEWAHTCVSNW